ncbi:MAG: Uma2 family endonuclease, partial [Thiohalocapsa sp.]
YTLNDYRQWEGDWELIQGIPLAMALSPAIEHQRVSGQIHYELLAAFDMCPSCEAIFEIDVEFSQDTVVRPDVLAICYTPEGERLTRVPELIFEVLSPSTARRDEQIKFQLYRDEGVTWYVLVYRSSAKAKVNRLIDGDYRKIGDFHDAKHCFHLSACNVPFDFGRIWRKPARA